jgi:hypothetical protein
VKRGLYRFWQGNLTEGDHLEDPSVNGRIILKWILEKWFGNQSGSGYGQVAGTFKAVMNLRFP